MICRMLMVLVAIVSSAASAQVTAISGATVHTMGPGGTVENATVLIDRGVIVAVGADIAVPGDATRIDATGLVITPGLVSPVGQLGLTEVGAVPDSVDGVQRGDRFTAGFDVADAYNPRSTLISVNRIEGITSAVTVPRAAAPDDSGNASHVLSGLGALVHLGDAGDALGRRAAVMVANLGDAGSTVAGGSRAAALMVLKAALDDAIDYRQNKAAFQRGDWREYSVSATDLEALQNVLDRSMPLLVDANRASDLTAVAAMAQQYGIRVIVLGGAEAWMVAEQLAAANIAVILDAAGNLPADFDRLNARLESAALLHEAGIELGFGAGFAQTHNARNLTQAAGIAIANGLPWEAGLAAVTIGPARIYGVDDSIGSIEPGKRADLVLWPDDPLELTSFPQQVFIAGRAAPMQSRQTLLRDRYLQFESPQPPAYRR